MFFFSSQRKEFPGCKEDFQVLVKAFLAENPRANQFKKNVAGERWYESFLKRHQFYL